MAEASSLNCPACGGPVEMENRFVRMIVCGYCGNTLAVEDTGLDPTGKSAKLAETPTRFRVGATGSLRGSPYRILGRVRYQDDDCHWDEWYLEFNDGSIAWLEEEEGQYTLSHAQPLTSEVPSYDQARVGSTIAVNGQPFFVTERCTARVAGAEGQLYFRAFPGRTVRFVDGNIGGRTAAIEYGEDEIEFFVGEPLRRSEITVDGEAL
jgi:hypothetical protein